MDVGGNITVNMDRSIVMHWSFCFSILGVYMLRSGIARSLSIYSFEECNPHLHVQPCAQVQLNVLLFKNQFPRARELAQSLKALVALPEHLGSIPSTYMEAHNHL